MATLSARRKWRSRFKTLNKAHVSRIPNPPANRLPSRRGARREQPAGSQRLFPLGSEGPKELSREWASGNQGKSWRKVSSRAKAKRSCEDRRSYRMRDRTGWGIIQDEGSYRTEDCRDEGSYKTEDCTGSGIVQDWGLYRIRDHRGSLGGSVVWCLPSAQAMILDAWNRVPRRAPCMEPAPPSACVSASLALCLL